LKNIQKSILKALIVKPEESGQLRDAILELYRDTKKRNSFGNNGREYARKYFSKEIILPKFREELQHIINKS
jgi:glycosyltransferase involved in cell wall biosynthesis